MGISIINLNGKFNTFNSAIKGLSTSKINLIKPSGVRTRFTSKIEPTLFSNCFLKYSFFNCVSFNLDCSRVRNESPSFLASTVGTLGAEATVGSEAPISILTVDSPSLGTFCEFRVLDNFLYNAEFIDGVLPRSSSSATRLSVNP